MRSCFALPLVALLCAAPPAEAAQSYDGCAGFIDSIPTVIGTQGVWCLRKDVTTLLASGTAITIDAHNVTVDCNGFKVGGLAAGLATDGLGIAGNGRANATVRGCTVRGFRRGIHLLDADGAVVEGNRVEGATETGIHVHGSHLEVRGNRVRDIGGSTLPGVDAAWGIYADGDTDILDNLVAGVADTQAVGIAINAHGCTVAGNRVRDIVSAGASGFGAIQGLDHSRSIVRDNLLIGTGTGTGIGCADGMQLVHGNSIAGFATPVGLCNESGNPTGP